MKTATKPEKVTANSLRAELAKNPKVRLLDVRIARPRVPIGGLSTAL
ncbi:MAG: hypothetical protein M3Z25_05275 [Actinomycetota bacterium]|nr:hypothetical protein [Actinomycetota bacterium]